MINWMPTLANFIEFTCSIKTCKRYIYNWITLYFEKIINLNKDKMFETNERQKYRIQYCCTLKYSNVKVCNLKFLVAKTDAFDARENTGSL